MLGEVASVIEDGEIFTISVAEEGCESPLAKQTLSAKDGGLELEGIGHFSTSQRGNRSLQEHTRAQMDILRCIGSSRMSCSTSPMASEHVAAGEGLLAE